VGGDKIFKSKVEEAFKERGATVLVPFPANTENIEEIVFNKMFIPCRLLIENIFGLLKKKWAILRDRFRTHGMEQKEYLDLHDKIWKILATFHNFDVVLRESNGEQGKLARCQEWLEKQLDKDFFQKATTKKVFIDIELKENYSDEI